MEPTFIRTAFVVSEVRNKWVVHDTAQNTTPGESGVYFIFNKSYVMRVYFLKANIIVPCALTTSSFPYENICCQDSVLAERCIQSRLNHSRHFGVLIRIPSDRRECAYLACNDFPGARAGVRADEAVPDEISYA